jgi:type II secretory pathway pseudopilin PulG
VIALIRPLFALALGLAAAFLVACGSSGGGLIPADHATSLDGRLGAVSVADVNGDCSTAKAEAHRLRAQINQLRGIDHRLQSALRDGATKVLRQAGVDCRAPQTSLQTDTTTSPSTPSTPSTPTTPPSTPTTGTTPPSVPSTPTTSTGTQSTPSGSTNGGAGTPGTGQTGNGGASSGGGGKKKGKGK